MASCPTECTNRSPRIETASTAPGAAPAAIAESSVRAAGERRIDNAALSGSGSVRGGPAGVQAIATKVVANATARLMSLKRRGIVSHRGGFCIPVPIGPPFGIRIGDLPVIAVPLKALATAVSLAVVADQASR